MKLRTVIAGILFLAAVVVGYMLLQNQFTVDQPIEQNENTGNTGAVISDTPSRATLVGTYVCLPHKQGGPQTMECAFGVKADDGFYYALDMSAVSLPAGEIQTEDRISAEGLLVPIEQISTDQWSVYDIKGIMKVENLVKL